MEFLYLATSTVGYTHLSGLSTAFAGIICLRLILYPRQGLGFARNVKNDKKQQYFRTCIIDKHALCSYNGNRRNFYRFCRNYCTNADGDKVHLYNTFCILQIFKKRGLLCHR